MIKIAHRGNTFGPVPSLENQPEYILNAIEFGYDVEVDVWWNEGSIYFGHDFPQYLVTPEEFRKIKNHAWFHCKNLNALHHFLDHHPKTKFFWHQEDDFTLTSNGFIWTYPNKPVMDQSILVDLELENDNAYLAAGICTDYPSLI